MTNIKVLGVIIQTPAEAPIIARSSMNYEELVHYATKLGNHDLAIAHTLTLQMTWKQFIKITNPHKNLVTAIL